MSLEVPPADPAHRQGARSHPALVDGALPGDDLWKEATQGRHLRAHLDGLEHCLNTRAVDHPHPLSLGSTSEAECCCRQVPVALGLLVASFQAGAGSSSDSSRSLTSMMSSQNSQSSSWNSSLAMRMAGLPQRGQVTMVLSFHGRGPVDRSGPRIAAAARAAEERTGRFPRAVRPAAAQDAGSLSVAWPGADRGRLDQGLRMHMVGMVVSTSCALAGPAHE